MNKNPSLNNNKSLEESFKSSYHPGSVSSASTDEWVEQIRKFMVNKPVMVIDLNTFKLRPSKYQ
jgi:hypothetical protein